MIQPIIKKEHVWSNENFVKLFSEIDIKKCIEFENELFCENKSPVWHKARANACEWQLFTNNTVTNCEYEKIELMKPSQLTFETTSLLRVPNYTTSEYLKRRKTSFF